MLSVDKALSKEIMINNQLQNKVLELEVKKKAQTILKKVIIVFRYLENLSPVILANLKVYNSRFEKFTLCSTPYKLYPANFAFLLYLRILELFSREDCIFLKK